jgi:hypothetical protein
MSALHMFRIQVTNMTTEETATFLGQGTTMEEAFKDGYKNVKESYRHRQDGRPHPPLPLTVHTADGAYAPKDVKHFETGIPPTA